MIIVANRLSSRMAEQKLSQSELARRVGVTQTTIRKLLSGGNGSKYLHRIARALETTAEYLVGETDNPASDAPLPPPPAPFTVTMEVVLPREAALVQMFEALLATIDPQAPRDEQALLLAQRLPIGLSQLRDLRPDNARSPRSSDKPAAKLPAALAPARVPTS